LYCSNFEALLIMSTSRSVSQRKKNLQATKKAMTATLPGEIWSSILTYLDEKTLAARIMPLNRNFYALASADGYWSRLYDSIFSPLRKANAFSPVPTIVPKNTHEVAKSSCYDSFLILHQKQHFEQGENHLLEREMHGMLCDVYISPEEQRRYDELRKQQEYIRANVSVYLGFTSHPMYNPDTVTELSESTVLEQAKLLLKLHYKIEAMAPQLSNVEYVKHVAIPRYLHFLQLWNLDNASNYEQQNSNMIPQMVAPTLEIEAIWLSHLIRTQKYRSFCVKHFEGKILNHKIYSLTKQQWKHLYDNTLVLWNQEFPPDQVNVKFDNESNPVCAAKSAAEAAATTPLYDKSVVEYLADKENMITAEEVVKDRQWFKEYLQAAKDQISATKVQSQIYNPQFTECLHKTSYKNYEKFLFLVAKHIYALGTVKSLHPAAPIDLMWHAHMAQPYEYEKDCKRLFATKQGESNGAILHHHPWPKDLAVLKQESDMTAKLWTEEFDLKKSKQAGNCLVA